MWRGRWQRSRHAEGEVCEGRGVCSALQQSGQWSTRWQVNSYIEGLLAARP